MAPHTDTRASSVLWKDPWCAPVGVDVRLRCQTSKRKENPAFGS